MISQVPLETAKVFADTYPLIILEVAATILIQNETKEILEILASEDTEQFAVLYGQYLIPSKQIMLALAK
jgi:hypothetical protein